MQNYNCFLFSNTQILLLTVGIRILIQSHICRCVKKWGVLPIWGQFVAFGHLHHLTSFEVKTQSLGHYRHHDPGQYFPQHYHVFASPSLALSPSSNA